MTTSTLRIQQLLSLPLLLLLLPSTSRALLDGFPSELRESFSTSNETVAAFLRKGSDASAPGFCDDTANTKNELKTNFDRLCPVAYDVVKPRDGIAEHVIAACQCRKQRSSSLSDCGVVRMPVTELLFDGPGRRRLVEVVTLRAVDCATILRPSVHPKASSMTLNGTELRDAGRQVRRPLFQHVQCPLHRPAPPISLPMFSLRLDSELVPQKQPVARCPCEGQSVTSLPLGVLRLTEDGSALREDLEIVDVWCAVLELPQNTN